MMKKQTDLAWERWGHEDPYFGVVTNQKYRRVNIHNTKADFFQSGQLHVTRVLAEIRKHFGSSPTGSALDFGCGVGRLLIPLSKEFNHVVGLDVSKSMLREAARNLAERGIENVDLLESDDTLSQLRDRTFDFIHTYIVLQHIRPKRGYKIISGLVGHLSAHGTFCMHICYRRNFSFLRELVYHVKNRCPGAHILFNVLQRKRMFEPTMEMNEYDVGTMLEIFQQAGFRELTIRLEAHGDSQTAAFYSKKGLESKCGA